MFERLLKKIFKTIGMLVLLIVVIIVAAVVNKPTEQEKKQKEAKELADKKLDELRNACEAYVRKSVINKSTLDMSAFGSNRWLGNDGKFYATQELALKTNLVLSRNSELNALKTRMGKRITGLSK